MLKLPSLLETANAQNPITTLEHAGTTTIFYGQNSLVDAYTAAVNGDNLYLSTGFFTAPTAIAKGIKIIGAGHFPDSLNVARRTTILSGLKINAGADSLLLEGLYINGDISYAAASSINYVKVIRCRLGNATFNSSSTTASKNNCSFDECFIDGGISFSKYGNNLFVKHCVIQNGITNVDGNALIDSNVFLSIGSINWIYSSKVINNIILGNSQYNNDFGAGYTTGTVNSGNSFNNNLFVSSSINFSSNSQSNNYLGVAQANIFVNQTGSAIDYSHDYHLKSPTTYLGTDGTQVGLYGGTTPFKDKGLPSNPQILTKSVGNQTDANGNLQINFKVKAQDN